MSSTYIQTFEEKEETVNKPRKQREINTGLPSATTPLWLQGSVNLSKLCNLTKFELIIEKDAPVSTKNLQCNL